MSRDELLRRRLGRRHFLGLTAGGAAFALVACGNDDDDDEAALPPTPTPEPDEPEPDPTPTPEPDDDGDEVVDQGQVLIGDVVDHALEPQGWAGDYGFVTFRLHTGVVDGEPAYFIRCDASDEAFAQQEGLVHVPLMENALDAGAGYADLYLFENGVPGQLPVLSTAPHMDDFTPAYRISIVRFNGDPVELDSASAVAEAASDGDISIEATNNIVNYPVVKWPGGEMPHDEVRTDYLGDGQLLEPVDVDGGTVTFKLHKCFPLSRYIVTDVSMAPMAPMMNVAPSPGTHALTDAGATAKILVFGNGIEGAGPMGFQKSVTDTNPGDAEWSSFWDHFTFVWEDGTEPEVLRNYGEVQAREDAGDLQRFNGTPDSHPELFVVNCPVPVIAPVEE